MEQEKTVRAQSASKKVVEFEIVESDRIELIAQANRFIECMRSDGYAGGNAMTREEAITYDTALTFLHRQFSYGPKDSEAIETRVDLEISG